MIKSIVDIETKIIGETGDAPGEFRKLLRVVYGNAATRRPSELSGRQAKETQPGALRDGVCLKAAAVSATGRPRPRKLIGLGEGNAAQWLHVLRQTLLRALSPRYKTNPWNG
jgi:hypothetical protein